MFSLKQDSLMAIQPSSPALPHSLEEHLASWGLRSFSTEADYYAWQQEVLTREELVRLHDLAGDRQGNPAADLAFYDLAASPSVLPVLYSERYHYYLEVGSAVAAHLSSGQGVLDFGCGVGILTTWYAKLFPEVTFTGIDRSSQSIAVALRHAQTRGIKNVHFSCVAIPDDELPGPFDCIVSTHALFQSETDPGLPSQTWQTFERARDVQVQEVVEKRTGIKDRLDSLLRSLSSGATLILFEKSGHLGRRVLLQRALAARGFQTLVDPRVLSYQSIDQMVQDGPLYVLRRTSRRPTRVWVEEPEVNPDQRLYGCTGASAEWVWPRLPNRRVKWKQSWEAANREKIYLECGEADGALTYGYMNAECRFRGVVIGSLSDEPFIDRFLDKAMGNCERDPDWSTALVRIWPKTGEEDLTQTPLYENHTPAAQEVWQQLSGRKVYQQETAEEPDGRQRHIEFGTCARELAYLYWANTFDQRQIVIMDQLRVHILEEYFLESVKGNPADG